MRSFNFPNNLIKYSLVKERKRSKETGRRGNYSGRIHSVGEMSRRELRKQRKTELRQGLNPGAEDNSGANSNPTDMESNKDYRIG